MVKLDCNFWLWALEEIHWFLSVIINHKKIFLNLLFNPVLPRDITDDTFHKQTVHVTHNNHVTDGLTCTWEAMYYGHCITRKSYISTYIFPSPLSIHSVWNSYFWNRNFFSKLKFFFEITVIWNGCPSDTTEYLQTRKRSKIQYGIRDRTSGLRWLLYNFCRRWLFCAVL